MHVYMPFYNITTNNNNKSFIVSFFVLVNWCPFILHTDRGIPRLALSLYPLKFNRLVPFLPEDFPGYSSRNVGHNLPFPFTESFVHVFDTDVPGVNNPPSQETYIASSFTCGCCRRQLSNKKDFDEHLLGKKHHIFEQHEIDWLAELEILRDKK